MLVITVSLLMPILAWQSQSPHLSVENRVSTRKAALPNEERKVVTNVCAINRDNSTVEARSSVFAPAAEGETATLTATLVYDPEIYSFVQALIKTTTGEIRLDSYGEEEGKVVIEHTPGIFDIVFIFKKVNKQTTFIVKENIDLAKTKELTVNVDEAVNEVVFSYFLPNGEEERPWKAEIINEEGDYKFIEEGNVSNKTYSVNNSICIGDSYDKIIYTDSFMGAPFDWIANEYSDGHFWKESAQTIRINDVSPRVSLVSSHSTWVNEKTNVVEEIWRGGGETNVSNKGQKYYPLDITYVNTPYYSTAPVLNSEDYFKNEMYINAFQLCYGDGRQDWVNQFLSEMTCYDICKMTTQQENLMSIAFSSVQYALPGEWDTAYYTLACPEIFPTPSGKNINALFNRDYCVEKIGDAYQTPYDVILENPFGYEYTLSDLAAGESSPFWRMLEMRGKTRPGSNLVLFNTGMIGEQRTIDLLSTKIVSVKGGDKDYTEEAKFNPYGGLSVYDDNTESGMKWEMEFDNTNFIRDGIQGHSRLKMTYTTKDDPKYPVLQQIQMRNSMGRVTDRFDTSADGSLMIGAGIFSYVAEPDISGYYDHYYTQCLPEDVPELKVEYAPNGIDAWHELDMEMDPAKFYSLGMGQYYECPLSQVKHSSANKWYDLRITISGEGDSQIQTISPAFRIENIPVDGITLSESEIELEEGWSKMLTVTVNPEGVMATDAVWSTSDAEVATVSDGVVRAVGEGECTVTAELGGKAASCKVKVIPASQGNIAVTAVTLDKTEASIAEGETLQLTATVMPENATYKELSWKSSDTSVATVDAQGLVTAVKPGEAEIIATSCDGTEISVSCLLKVSKADSVGSLTADEGTVEVWTDDGILLSREATDEDIRALASGLYILRGKTFVRKYLAR